MVITGEWTETTMRDLNHHLTLVTSHVVHTSPVPSTTPGTTERPQDHQDSNYNQRLSFHSSAYQSIKQSINQ